MDIQKNLAIRIHGLCRKIREQRPLIHVVTNFVVMNQTANALLALGAAPTMSWAREDLEYMSGISDGLCINMGTPTRERVEAMITLMALAQQSKKPLVLDPVGSGAGPHRTEIARQLSALAPHKIIRGNASEICSLTHEHTTTRGVDSTISPADAKEILVTHGRTADQCAPDHQHDLRDKGVEIFSTMASCVVTSGKEDMVLDNTRTLILKNGSDLMNAVTGTGCILSAITAAFYAVCPEPFEAATAACATSAIAGEIAAEKASGPGTFLPHFMDSLYNLDEKTLITRLKTERQFPYPSATGNSNKV
ncbi:hydroxyethylthiazole kinase [Desulfocicer vacuolatum DSM 3385]|uniref:Hydroxyethylthiazole kinase n=1 Tax=Desulfocicer vacuolatum DSM 3385 TaxID=1121400 RepID=A0A1W2ELJ9_9BACT|nr:hydroxyethylthiazole kinase [Desulfocicer vacuolatum]SMD10597.1 hydroxyethylthiazole kinase [Desulfocicer vacuolatum DSM 3385]